MSCSNDTPSNPARTSRSTLDNQAITPGAFKKGHGKDVYYPCDMDAIGKQTMLVNPCPGQRHGTPEPFWPGSPEYDEQMDALVRVAMDVERDIWPAWYFEYCGVDTELSPVLRAVGLDESDPKGCADAVRMDQPGELWSALINYSAEEKVDPEPHLYQDVGQRFLERYVYPAEEFHTELTRAMRGIFEVKYYWGVERPEETVRSANFSQYPEGCPMHPSYGAGHGCVGGVANRVYKKRFPHANPQHFHHVEMATRQFAHFRDLARVHTKQDSDLGWRFGNGEYSY